jgi:hypothetical protein
MVVDKTCADQHAKTGRPLDVADETLRKIRMAIGLGMVPGHPLAANCKQASSTV